MGINASLNSQIFELHAVGTSVRNIGRKLGMAKSSVHRIIQKSSVNKLNIENNIYMSTQYHPEPINFNDYATLAESAALIDVKLKTLTNYVGRIGTKRLAGIDSSVLEILRIPGKSLGRSLDKILIKRSSLMKFKELKDKRDCFLKNRETMARIEVAKFLSVRSGMLFVDQLESYKICGLKVKENLEYVFDSDGAMAFCKRSVEKFKSLLEEKGFYDLPQVEQADKKRADKTIVDTLIKKSLSDIDTIIRGILDGISTIMHIMDDMEADIDDANEKISTSLKIE